MADDPRSAIPTPDADVLTQLPADAWATVLAHARRALNALEDDQLNLRLKQLRAVPVSRLSAGRSRADLARALAGGGPLWRETARGLEDDPGGRAVLEVLRGDADVEALVAERAADPDAEERQRAAEEERRRADLDRRRKERARELQAERDQALRRADGLEQRLATTERRVQDLERELAQLTEERDRLVRQVEEAREEGRRDLERLRRQADSDARGLREEVRDLRRYREEVDEELRNLRRERDEAVRVARERPERGDGGRAADDTFFGRRRNAAIGRPSQLPPGVEAGTTEAARALLTPGRVVVVDGYNVTKQHQGQLSLENQRAWLVRTLEGLAARYQVQPRVVFDGQPGAGVAASSRQVAVEFTSGGTADDAIVRLIELLPPDEPILVVTEDRELAGRIRSLRGDVITPRQLLGLV